MNRAPAHVTGTVSPVPGAQGEDRLVAQQSLSYCTMFNMPVISLSFAVIYSSNYEPVHGIT